MKQNESPQQPVFDPGAESPDFRAPLADLSAEKPVTFPSFPTPEQLLQHASGAMPHPLLLTDEKPEPVSLFQGLMGGNLDALVQDSVERPERYDEPTQSLLSELGSGARKLGTLTSAEKIQLDNAVLDFASAKPRNATPTPVLPFKAKAQSKAPSDPYAPGLQDGRAPQVEDAGGVMRSAYWWAD